MFNMDYPEKSWSLSKQRLFEECKRKYYYKTFMAWRGWKSDATKLERRAYLLGKLQNIYSLSGQAIHEEIRKAIKTKSFSVEDSFQNIRKQLRQSWVDSVDHREDWEKWPKEYIMLSEIYYGRKDFLRSKSKDILNRIKTSLENFAKSRSYRMVVNDRVDVLEVDEDFPSFEHEGVKVFSIIDFLYRDKETNTLVIVDWKTGQPNPDRDPLQLRLYTIYVLEKYDNVERIKCVNEYLLQGKSEVYTFDEEQLSEMKDYISRCIKQMDDYLEDPEINKPKDISYFPAERSEKCAFCEFKEICHE